MTAKQILATSITLTLAGLVGCAKKDAAVITAPPTEPVAPVVATPIQPMAPIQPVSDAPITVAPAAEPIAPAARAAGRTYTVQKGDTLFKIARNQYGDATAVRKIKDANPGLNADQIKVGQKLNLP
ncbi:MAG TPA: LysM peptidoglycan-binding domain-containing protein [Tepidisphaeraceae bacterium]|nr:LysM peptidoglycan-binding domain-containing protein [Tepidisphaeraceae bacterium]